MFHLNLRRQIQMDEEKGHNPTEDAVAALELAQYFIKAGPRQVTQYFVTYTHTHTHGWHCFQCMHSARL